MTFTARAHSSTSTSSWAADCDALSCVQTLVQKTAVGSIRRALLHVRSTRSICR